MNDVRDYQDKIDRYREEHPDMHYLYRYYNDEGRPGHQLLYIGITVNMEQRDYFHRWNSPWRRTYPVSRIELDIFPDERSALAAERVAIENEIPCHNSEHNRNRNTTHEMGDCVGHTTRNIAEDMRDAMRKLGEALDLDSIFPPPAS